MHWYPTTGAPERKATINVATAAGIHSQQNAGGKIACVEIKNDNGTEKEINHQPLSAREVNKPGWAFWACLELEERVVEWRNPSAYISFLIEDLRVRTLPSWEAMHCEQTVSSLQIAKPLLESRVRISTLRKEHFGHEQRRPTPPWSFPCSLGSAALTTQHSTSLCHFEHCSISPCDSVQPISQPALGHFPEDPNDHCFKTQNKGTAWSNPSVALLCTNVLYTCRTLKNVKEESFPWY